MKIIRLRKALTALLLVLALAAASMPAALAAGYQAVITRDTKVYTAKAPYKCIGELTKGSSVRVRARSGKAALIGYHGKYFIVAAKNLKRAAKAQNIPVVTRCATRVYQRPNKTAKYISVKPGTEMTLVSLSGGVAKVKYKGRVAYTMKTHLRRATSLEPDPSPSLEDVFSGSTEEIIIKFMMQKMGYSRAAACGVAANIWFECSFDHTCVGDYGTSYGIVQWHANRKSNLISWCSSNGYNYTSLKGQLYFLKYELTTQYPKVHSYLKSLGNTGKDAYNAGYYFCYHFEVPASRSSQSVKRGNYARDSLFLSYT